MVVTATHKSRTPSPEPDSDDSVVDVTPSPATKRNKVFRKQRATAKPKSRPDVPLTPPEQPQTMKYKGARYWFTANLRSTLRT